MIASPAASPMQSGESESSPAFARARIYAHAWLGPDFGRTLTRGGGGTLALVAVAFAGLYLPGVVRLGLVAVGVLAVKLLERLQFGPLRTLLRPAVGLAVAWLALAWGLGLLEPVVAAALLVLVAAEARLWWQYRESVAAAAALADEVEPARPPTPDERLDALLAEAPIEGAPFAELVEAMEPYMSRSTVALRLKERGWKLGGGRWRARPAGVDGP